MEKTGPQRRRGATNLPTTTNGLQAWFRGSSEGKALFQSLACECLEGKCRSCQEMQPYPKVLVVLRRLGKHPGVEVYAEHGTSVRLVELPDVPDDAFFREKADGILELDLPKSWRHLLRLPSRRVWSDVFRGVTAEEALRFERDWELIRSYKEMREELDTLRGRGGKKAS